MCCERASALNAPLHCNKLCTTVNRAPVSHNFTANNIIYSSGPARPNGLGQHVPLVRMRFATPGGRTSVLASSPREHARFERRGRNRKATTSHQRFTKRVTHAQSSRINQWCSARASRLLRTRELTRMSYNTPHPRVECTRAHTFQYLFDTMSMRATRSVPPLPPTPPPVRVRNRRPFILIPLTRRSARRKARARPLVIAVNIYTHKHTHTRTRMHASARTHTHRH